MRPGCTPVTHETTVPVVTPVPRAYSPQVDTPGHRRLRRVLARLVLAACACLTLQTLLATAADADPAATDWHRLRDCESSDNYTADTGNGYYGAYQFDPGTWHSVGGTGLPHENTPAEQDYRALYLYRMRGWQPWECGTRLGLRDDTDARSHRVPTREEATYIGENPTPPPPVIGNGKAPVWPGVVYARGDCAPGLRTFQLAMNRYGYHFDGTGCYADKTLRAVLDLQRANGINPSGRLGPKTWQAAWTGTAPKPGH